MMVFKLAWRNIWRNKRRTFITAASIFFAVLFSIFMNAMQKGAWTKMLDDVVHYYTGYIQIHDRGYWNEKSINKLMPQEMLPTLQGDERIKAVLPRLESFVLVSHEAQTAGMMLVGIDPSTEDEMTGLSKRIIHGTYLNSINEEGLIIGEGVQEKLKISLGDSLVMIGQGYHGVNAVGKYPVIGIASFASPDLNKRMIYLPLPLAQQFFGAEGLLSSVALDLTDKKYMASVKQSILSNLGTDEYEIMDWKEMMPELLEAQQTDAAGNYIFLFVLYMIISFGIMGTVLMMVKERSYEFGVLNAIGMKRKTLSGVVYLEVILLGLIGAIVGMILAFPLVYYFNIHPIDLSNAMEGASDTYEKWGFSPIFPTTIEWSIFLSQALIVFVLTSIMALYPIWKIYRLKPVEAMKG